MAHGAMPWPHEERNHEAEAGSRGDRWLPGAAAPFFSFGAARGCGAAPAGEGAVGLPSAGAIRPGAFLRCSRAGAAPRLARCAQGCCIHCTARRSRGTPCVPPGNRVLHGARCVPCSADGLRWVSLL